MAVFENTAAFSGEDGEFDGELFKRAMDRAADHDLNPQIVRWRDDTGAPVLRLTGLETLIEEFIYWFYGADSPGSYLERDVAPYLALIRRS